MLLLALKSIPLILSCCFCIADSGCSCFPCKSCRCRQNSQTRRCGCWWISRSHKLVRIFDIDIWRNWSWASGKVSSDVALRLVIVNPRKVISPFLFTCSACQCWNSSKLNLQRINRRQLWVRRPRKWKLWTKNKRACFCTYAGSSLQNKRACFCKYTGSSLPSNKLGLGKDDPWRIKCARVVNILVSPWAQVTLELVVTWALFTSTELCKP